MHTYITYICMLHTHNSTYLYSYKHTYICTYIIYMPHFKLLVTAIILYILCKLEFTTLSYAPEHILATTLHCYCSLYTDHRSLHISLKKQPATFISHLTAVSHQMLHICHKCKLCHTYIQGEYTYTYATYEVTCNYNHYTANTTIHHTVIWSWTNMATTLNTFLPLHCYCILHIYPHITACISRKTTNYNSYVPCF